MKSALKPISFIMALIESTVYFMTLEVHGDLFVTGKKHKISMLSHMFKSSTLQKISGVITS